MISHWDLGEKKPSLQDLVEIAKQFNRDAGTAFLARLNLYLSLARQSNDGSEGAEVQERLTKEVLSGERVRQLEEVFAGRGLYREFILLNRAQLLAGIKLLALYGRDDGGNPLESAQDKTQIGELALAINSCYGPAFGETPWPLEDVMAQTAAGAELNNPGTLVNDFVRTRILIGPILRDYLAGLKGARQPPPFERIFTLLNGINFRDFLDITLYLHLHETQMLDELMEAQAMTYADVKIPKRYVSGRFMKAWADLMAVNHKDLRAVMHDRESELRFFFDFSVFRRFPLWRADDHRYFSIDADFLRERLSSFGFYWAVVNGLVDEEIQSSFQRVWGELIQEYVWRILSKAHQGCPGAFLPKPVYSDDGTEVFDAAIVADDGLAPIEIKGSVIPARRKYAGEGSAFYEGISAKFGSGPGAAVEQLLRNLGQIFSENHPRQSSIPVGDVREIFPVVVVHEPVLRFGFGTNALADEFLAGVRKLAVRSPMTIHRLQVLDVETVERLVPYLQEGDFTLLECLRAAARECPPRMGFWQFMVTRFLSNRKVKSRADPELMARFKWLTDAVTWRVYRGDYYDHSLASRGQPSKRAIICVRPVGGDDLLREEAVAFEEFDNVEKAYERAESIKEQGFFPNQKIRADWIEYAVVNEFGGPLGKPPT